MGKNTIHNHLTACIIAVLSCALVPSCQKETIDEQQTTQANTNTKPEYVAPEEEDVLIEAAEKATLMSHEEKDGVTTFRFTEAFVSEITKKEVALVSIKSEHFYFQSDKHDACILVFKDKKTTKLQYNNDLSLSLDHLTNVLAYPGESVEIAFELTASGRGGVEISAEADKGSFELDYNKDRKEGSIHVVLPDEDKSAAHVRLILDDGVNKTYYNIHAEGYYIEFTSVQGGMTLSGEKGEKTTLTVGYITNLAEPALELSSENESVTYEILSSTQDEQTGGWESVIEFAFSSDNNTGDDVTADVTVAERSLRYGKTSVTLIQGTLQPVRKDGQVFFDHWALKKAMNAIADRDGDGEVSFEEALKVTKVNLSHKEITNIHGLEYFKNIEWLDVSHTPVDSLMFNNIESFSKLRYINIEGTKNVVLNIEGTYLYNTTVDHGRVGPLNLQYNEEKIPYASKDFSRDGNWVTLQKHTRGQGINIIFCSRGIDLDYESGAIYELIENCIETLFSKAPLDYFKDCFDIYVTEHVDKLSTEDINGTLCCTPEQWGKILDMGTDIAKKQSHQTVIEFQCYQTPWESKTIACSELFHIGWSNHLYMGVGYTRSGNVTSIKTTVITFVHEMGHNLGGLKDQYKNYYSPNAEYINASGSGDPEKVLWKRFLDLDNYKGRVGIYKIQDAYYPNDTEQSVMCGCVSSYFDPTTGEYIDNYELSRMHFDSPSRYSFFRNIYMCGKLDYTDDEDIWQQFLEYDVVNNDIPI